MNTRAMLLLPALLAASGAHAQACKDNFQSSGNFLTGNSYRTQAPLPGVAAAHAFQRALQFTMENGFTVLNANPHLGQISAAQSAQMAKGKQVPLNIVVREDGSGAVVTMNYTLGPGQISPESAIKEHFCKTIEAAAAGGATAAPVAAGAAPVRGGAPSRASVRGVSQPTEAQLQAMAQAVRKGPHPAALKPHAEDLLPTLEKWVERMACMNTYTAAKSLDEFAAPRSLLSNRYTAGYPMSRTQYHDSNQCMSVLRVQGWRMPADNALQFEVVYKAEDSGETATTNHEVVRQPDGSWLFNH